MKVHCASVSIHQRSYEEIGDVYENFILFNVVNGSERARDNSSASVL
jgi:hypothetical protein